MGDGIFRGPRQWRAEHPARVIGVIGVIGVGPAQPGYGATTGAARSPPWLDTDWLLAQFAPTRREAIERYARFVQDGVRATSPWKALKHQGILGDDTFVARFRAPDRLANLSEISKTQRQPLADALAVYRARYTRDAAMARAYLSGAYSMKEIGNFFGVHYMAVSRTVRSYEQRKMLECET
jgi:putative transposase